MPQDQPAPPAEEKKNVGLGSGVPGSADQAVSAPGEPRSRPVFKMRRTGRSGPFPFSGRPVSSLPSPTVTNGTHGPAAPSIASGASQSPKHVPPASLGDGTKAQQHDRATSAATNPIASGPSPGSAQTLTPAKGSTPSSSGLVEPDVKMAGQSPGQTPTSLNPRKRPPPPDIQQLFHSAFDDRPYRSWKDESGQTISTAGALLPQGYQKSDHPAFPWLCPVRSCRKMLATIGGLGKHFINAHRAVRLNDNLDGTFSDLGTYASPAAGNGRSAGGFVRTPLVVSKMPMSLTESPMVEPSLHGPPPKPERQPMATDEGSFEGSDSQTSDTENVSAAPSGGHGQNGSRPADSKVPFRMANPDRPYSMYLNAESGELVTMHGALIPDGYKHDTTVPDRPWICPIRSCRRLFKKELDLGHHFKRSHRGCQLNDNLDGTLSVVKDNGSTTSPVVVSRSPMDIEPLAEPTRPVYPNPLSSSIIWVKAGEEDGNLLAAMDDASSAAETRITPASAKLDTRSGTGAVGPNAGIKMATADRPYSEWWDGNGGQLVHMHGALIPEGYQYDHTFPDRPYVCPVRSCRAACKVRHALGWHFTHCHRVDELNDNGDGTFSVVGTHLGGAARVVSRRPLDPNEPPMEGACEPSEAWERMAARRRVTSQLASAAHSHSTPTNSPAAPSDTWQHICSQFKDKIPDPTAPALKPLRNLPRVRDLVTVRGSTLSTDLNTKQLAALLIQVTGEESQKPCSECRRNNGPFPSCVRSSAEVGQQTVPFMGTSSRACANCLFRKNSSACSIRAYNSAWFTSVVSKPAPPESVSESFGAADRTMSEDIPDRRRSVRRSAAILQEDDDDDEYQGESVPEPPAEPRPRRPVTLQTRVPATSRAGSGANSGQPKSRRFPVLTSNSVSETDLHMEDWEADDGRIWATGNGLSEPLAFSSAYLAANQSVQLSDAITVLTVIVPSGAVHQFQTDRARTRICSLLSGKVRVQVAGEPEFVVGSHGIFKIAPGASCSVSNRCYFDVVLHVTSLEEA